MLSIVIPVYNSEAYLTECVSSVLSQSYRDIEVILVDDGSRDGSGKICDDLAKTDARVKVVHQQNAGVSVARNRGLEMASGDWISFVDSDDKVASDYAEQFFAQEQLADLTFFPHVDFDADGNKREYQQNAFFTTDREVMEREILNLKCNDQQFEFFGYTWNKFFRADIIREHKVRFKSGLIFREDEVFTAEYCQYAKSLAVMKQPIYFYRRGTGGLTAKKMKVDDYLLLANLTEEMRHQFSCSELVRYENFRIMYMYLDALLAADNIGICYHIAKAVGCFHDRCGSDYPKDKLPYGLIKNIHSPLRMMWWLYKKRK